MSRSVMARKIRARNRELFPDKQPIREVYDFAVWQLSTVVVKPILLPSKTELNPKTGKPKMEVIGMRRYVIVEHFRGEKVEFRVYKRKGTWFVIDSRDRENMTVEVFEARLTAMLKEGKQVASILEALGI